MTLIKASAAIGVTPFRPGGARAAERSGQGAVDPKVAGLEAEVMRLRSELETAERRALAAVADAREEGAREVKLEHAAHLEAVEAGIVHARASWEKRLGHVETLAVAIARAALSRMFDEHDDLVTLVERTVVTHVARIGASAVVKLRVSPIDFPDADALARVGARIGLSEEAVVGDPALSSGESRLDLRLGGANLDVAAQWHEVDAALAALEPVRAAA